MKQKMYIMRGLPGSGKTTAARAMSDTNANGVRYRVNRDDIRRMLGKYDDFSKQREDLVTEIERNAVKSALDYKASVIIDDCNLNPLYVSGWEDIAKAWIVEVEVVDFTNVPLRECLKRNTGRPKEERVSNKIIHDMYNRWLAPKKQEYVEGLPTAVICDLDGTLALLNGRNPYNASTCENDLLNVPVAKILHKMADAGHHILLVSGREDTYAPQTMAFLKKNGIYSKALFMRKARDERPDWLVKEEIYNDHIKGKYNVEFCIDDRDRIVDMWRSQGLTCFQVDEGWF